ncbi:MAG: PilZ domain-containing protein [bacterium]|nr:PilZ domain-containing protein [bacterium]
MYKNRQRPRKNTPHLVKAVDHATGQVIGRVVDITADGMMLVSSTGFNLGDIFELRINLPVMVHYRSDVDVRAEVMWSGPDTNPQYYKAGFKFVSLANDDGYLLEEVMHKLNLVG